MLDDENANNRLWENFERARGHQRYEVKVDLLKVWKWWKKRKKKKREIGK